MAPSARAASGTQAREAGAMRGPRRRHDHAPRRDRFAAGRREREAFGRRLDALDARARPQRARRRAARRAPRPARRARRAASRRRRAASRRARASAAAPPTVPRTRLPCTRSSSRKRGKVARIESRSGSPAWIPASSGSPRRSTASCPKRRRRNDAIDSSPSPFFPGITRSSPMRSLPGQEKRPLARKGRIFVGHRQHHPLGQRVELAAVEDEDRALLGVGGDQALAEPELAAERDRLGLLRQHRVGAALEQEAVPRLGADHSAEALARLEQEVGHLLLVERERRGQPGDAAADDRDRRLRHRSSLDRNPLSELLRVPPADVPRRSAVESS